MNKVLREPFTKDSWDRLPNICFISGCNTETGIDERGPVTLRDGTMHKACIAHWGPIMRVLGEQADWERESMRNSGR